MKPNLREEKKLWQKGYKRVAGLDESGRGPLAGPVMAVAVIIKNPKSQIPRPTSPASGLAGGRANLKQIRNSKAEPGRVRREKRTKFSATFQTLNLKDSKKLTPKKREEFYKILIKNPLIEWGIGRVSEKVIDKVNILEATKLAMKKALKNLEKKMSHISYDRRKCGTVDYLIIDGNFKIDLPIPQKSIIKADEKVFSCALASILAKVWRDKIMEKYHRKFLKYRFDKHKGYPTKLHLKMLKKYGPCKIHRKSFKPVKKLLIANC